MQTKTILQRVESLEEPNLESTIKIVQLQSRIERLEGIIESMGYYISRK